MSVTLHWRGVPTLDGLATFKADLEERTDREGSDFAVAYRLNLVIEELWVNAIHHGAGSHAAGGRPEIEVFVRGDGDQWTVSMLDHGPAFDPFTAALPNITAPLEERAIGGLGIHLVRKLVNSVAYERHDDCNVVRASIGPP